MSIVRHVLVLVISSTELEAKNNMITLNPAVWTMWPANMRAIGFSDITVWVVSTVCVDVLGVGRGEVNGLAPVRSTWHLFWGSISIKCERSLIISLSTLPNFSKLKYSFPITLSVLRFDSGSGFPFSSESALSHRMRNCSLIRFAKPRIKPVFSEFSDWQREPTRNPPSHPAMTSNAGHS